MNNNWISVSEQLPEMDTLVWLLDQSKPSIYLGCRTTPTNDGWLWAISYDSPVYDNEKKQIVSDCYLEDIEVSFWQPCPKLPTNFANITSSDEAMLNKSLLADFFWQMVEDYHLWDETLNGEYPFSRALDAIGKFNEQHNIIKQ